MKDDAKLHDLIKKQKEKLPIVTSAEVSGGRELCLASLTDTDSSHRLYLLLKTSEDSYKELLWLQEVRTAVRSLDERSFLNKKMLW